MSNKLLIKKLCSFPACLTFAPATAYDLAKTDKILLKNGFSPIPEYYRTFLAITNGYSYNGIEFFGTKSHYREQLHYTFPDLIASSMHYKEYTFFNQKIILGRISESIIFYDQKTQLYAIADRLTLGSGLESKDFNCILQTFHDICCL